MSTNVTKFRLARPPPPPPTDNERRVSMKTDFVKLTCNGHAVFRPNLRIERRAESVPGPNSRDQDTQTEEDRDEDPVLDVPPKDTMDINTGPGGAPFPPLPPLPPLPLPFICPYSPPGVVCKCCVGVVYELVCGLVGSRRIRL